MSVDSLRAAEKTYRYVITETGVPTSLDPLDADNTNNLPVARMIYATPLEVTQGNQLSSRILESFRYDSETHTIHWVVKKGLKFGDDTPISPEDVAFAVTRMAHARPKFPVLENIVGVKKWAESKSALESLPEGMKISGQEIAIHLDKNIGHPLFRFCLELFSIIPKRCVDLEKNTITCKDIPISGPYKITEKAKEFYRFVKREGSAMEGAPSQIRFEYFSPEDFIKKVDAFDDSTVISGGESSYSIADLKLIQERLMTKFTPASRISFLLLNPEVEPFKNKKCRQYFSNEFRKSYFEVSGKSQPMEGSVFTKIMPGYLGVHELEEGSPLSNEEVAECVASLKGTEIRWGTTAGEKRALFIEALKQTAQRIGAKFPAPVVAANLKESADLFSNGKISISGGSSGFWALDPAGDMKMLFTPNLHKPLRFVSRDAKAQELIAGLQEESADFKKINRHLFAQADFNIYAHLRRFFASPSKTLLSDFPNAVSSPAPWQLFEVK